MKVSAYAGRDKIRDLFDVTFICSNYFEQLSPQTVSLLRSTVEHKGLAQFDYVMRTQPDELVDSSKLAEDFLNMYDKLGLLPDDTRRSI